MWFWIILAVVIVAIGVWYTRPPPPPRLRPITPIRSVSQTLSARKKKKAKKKVQGPPMLILWASQTGTAEEFAGTLQEEAELYGFDARSQDIEEYFNEGPERLNEEKGVVAFMLATYGEGEPPDNGKDITDWLASEDRMEGELSDLTYVVFGLGNKTYPDFNALARLYDKRLTELGATRLYERGEGDDECSLEEDFEAWRGGLWAPLCAKFNVVAQATPPREKAASYTVVYLDDGEKHSSHITWRKVDSSKGGVDAKNPLWCEVVHNRELHGSASDRSCRHVEVELGPGMSYEHGDHIGVFAPNVDEVVEEAARILDVDLDRVFKLVDDSKRVLIGPMTVRRALQYFVELTAIPRKSFLSHIVMHATDPDDVKRLNDAVSDQEKYNQWVKTPGRTVLEVLKDVPSCKLPFNYFLEVCPSMLPRYYSISSSPSLVQNVAHITAVKVEYTSATGRRHRGVATTALSDVALGSRLPSFIRKSTFRLPKDPKTPVIMIGPGTGVAPFRGFIQERLALRNSGVELGKAVLFFGCRHREHDFLYSHELEDAVNDGALTELFLAFSREQEKKVYVQHRMRENGQLLWDMIQDGGCVYVCGDARSMAKEVHRTLREIIMEHGHKDQTEAESVLTRLQTSGRYHQDVWT